MPNDMEYTMAEAYALKMAEEADGLILLISFTCTRRDRHGSGFGLCAGRVE